MSFQKIAGLQSQLQAEHSRAQQAEARLGELEGDAQRLWETVMRNTQLEGELRAKTEQVRGGPLAVLRHGICIKVQIRRVVRAEFRATTNWHAPMFCILLSCFFYWSKYLSVLAKLTVLNS